MVIVLMSAYNEEAALPDVLEHMPKSVEGHPVRIVVLSDGSTDRTAEVARSFDAEVMEFGENRGKGAALKSGLATLEDASYAVLVLMDADGQHDPSSLVSIVAPVLDGLADVVVGSRYMQNRRRGSTPWNRYVVRTTVKATLNTLLAGSVTDPFSGYRCLNPRAVQCLRLSGDRYESELEMIFCVEKNSLRLIEVPIPKLYGPGTSKMGARFGPVVGRIVVVSRYAFTIIRETYRLRGSQTVQPRRPSHHD
jgi:glycosyltransferase involved in cell wall biosynthesis